MWVSPTHLSLSLPCPEKDLYAHSSVTSSRTSANWFKKNHSLYSFIDLQLMKKNIDSVMFTSSKSWEDHQNCEPYIANACLKDIFWENGSKRWRKLAKNLLKIAHFNIKNYFQKVICSLRNACCSQRGAEDVVEKIWVLRQVHFFRIEPSPALVHSEKALSRTKLANGFQQSAWQYGMCEYLLFLLLKQFFAHSTMRIARIL